MHDDFRVQIALVISSLTYLIEIGDKLIVHFGKVN